MQNFLSKAPKCGVGLQLNTSLCYERVRHPLVQYYVVHGILLTHNDNTVHMCTQNTIDSTACFVRDTEHSNVTLIVKAVCSWVELPAHSEAATLLVIRLFNVVNYKLQLQEARLLPVSLQQQSTRQADACEYIASFYELTDSTTVSSAFDR